MHDTAIARHLTETSEPWIETIACRALSVVARASSGVPRGPDPEHLLRLRSCLLSMDREACRSAIRTMVAGGFSREDVADLYIPALARQLGREWCDDEIGFADVTIGSSRLQALLRELGPEWRADQMSAPDSPSALTLVHADENHTLGAQILAGQLRRKGFSVKFAVTASRAEIGELMKRADYDMVTISASRPETLESVGKLVDFVRAAARRVPPIVVGGCIDGRGFDIKALTGADLVTSNLEEALRLCGLRSHMKRDARLTLRR